MTVDPLQPLLETTLVLVAHPDDEVIVCGGLMQRMKRAVVVFATDGAPRDPTFWKQYGSREAYADVRRGEAGRALETVDAEAVFLGDSMEMDGGLADQELFRNLQAATAAVEKIVKRLEPDCMLTLAYEGGHPDHDAACFIASIVGPRARIPVWESPLYHRNAEGVSITQAFPQRSGNEIDARIEGPALEKKMRMFDHYRSQGLLINSFEPRRETFRPLAGYDFTRPPMTCQLNYEAWQWKMTGKEVSAVFSAFLEAERGVER